jgi:hypothetical protein
MMLRCPELTSGCGSEKYETDEKLVQTDGLFLFLGGYARNIPFMNLIWFSYGCAFSNAMFRVQLEL